MQASIYSRIQSARLHTTLEGRPVMHGCLISFQSPSVNCIEKTIAIEGSTALGEEIDMLVVYVLTSHLSLASLG